MADETRANWLPAATLTLLIVTLGLGGYFVVATQRALRAQHVRIAELEAQITVQPAIQLTRVPIEEPLGRVPIVVDRPTAADPDPRIIIVNERLGVYALSLGSDHGAHLGLRVAVLRDGREITQLVLDSVEPTASAGTIADDAPQVTVREGDRVKLITR